MKKNLTELVFILDKSGSMAEGFLADRFGAWRMAVVSSALALFPGSVPHFLSLPVPLDGEVWFQSRSRLSLCSCR